MTNNPVPTPQSGSGSSAGQPTQPLSPSNEKLWATLIHIGGIFVGIPYAVTTYDLIIVGGVFGGIVVSCVTTLIGYIVLKDRGAFVSAHAKTALNFQISFGIYSTALNFLGGITFGIASYLFVPLGIVMVIFSIIAAVAANKGELYSYRVSLPLIK